MGVRQDIKMVYGDGKKIYIYSHWFEADELKERIKKVLARKERWDDEGYLARMIFSGIIREDIDGETGYGLAPYKMGECKPVVVNLKDKTVDGEMFEDFINE